jgi:cysteine desulfurase
MDVENRGIYLDNHATTRCDPRVVEAMMPYLTGRYGNPSSRTHSFGQEAADAVERARGEVAAAIGAQPSEILFTSGATESNRLAIAHALAGPARRRCVASAIEHKSVLDAMPERLTKLPVGSEGVVDPDDAQRAIAEDVALVSVMAASNEIGTIQPIVEIAAACRARGAPLLCDATVAIGRMPVDVRALGVDYLSFSGHKIYGPKGVGALYARTGRTVARPGTPNVPGIVGLAKALALCLGEMPAERRRILALRSRLLDRLRSALDGMTVNGSLDRRVEANLNVCFAGIDGPSLQVALGGLAVSAGSACSSASLTPSHVLLALGRPRSEALASLRFGIGSFNTEADVDRGAEIVIAAVRKLRTAAGFTSGTLDSDRVLGKTPTC